MNVHRSRGVAGIVLAAGSSTRMGGHKLLLELGGETLVRRAVRAAGQAGLDPVLVVLGHEAERVREELAGLPWRAVLNPEHASGAGTSIRAGVAATPSEAAALVVTLADMPFVTASMIGTLVERYRAGGARVVVSRYGGTDAPPTLFDRSLFGELAALAGDRGARQVARRHESEAAVVSWPAEDVCDLDLPDDYARARRRLVGG
jgi:molybdenum cofactor cytidylyltransferase